MTSEKNYVEGKVVLITGAASGFGETLARKIASMGAIVVGGDINEEGMQKVASEICDAGGECYGLKTDVTVKEDVFAMANFAIEKFGKIDVLVNNAGVMPLAFFSSHERGLEAWEKCIDINIKGVLYGICAVYDQMMSQNVGHIINLSSIYGNYPVVGGSVYQATKVAVKYISDTLRQETRGHIKVTTIKPSAAMGTGLADTIVDQEAFGYALGLNAMEFAQLSQDPAAMAAHMDPNLPSYLFIQAPDLVDSIIYAINQPDGICISDITVRPTNELMTV